MRIAYVLTRAPFVDQEPFVIGEGIEILRQGDEVLFAPLRPSSRMSTTPPREARERSVGGSPWSVETLLSAAREIRRHPGTMRIAARTLLAAEGRDKRIEPFIRNSVTLPKALALTAALREWRPDHIHAHFAASTATAAWIAAQALEVPWSFSAHSATDIPKRNVLTGKTRAAEFVRVISEHGKASLREGIPEPLRSKVRLIPMGVSAGAPAEADVPTSEAFARRQDAPALLCAAHLKPVKGHVHLLDALAILRRRGLRPVVHLVGRGPLDRKLREQVSRLELTDQVVFHGGLPNRTVLDVLDAGLVDLSVLSSLSEGIPISLMEAMARGVRVVATDVGGVAELVSPAAGQLVPPRDPDALADAIARELTEREPGDRAGARAVVRDRFCLSTNVGELRRLFASPRAARGGEA